jgi:repressor LexA
MGTGSTEKIPLTESQMQVLRFIQKCLDERGTAPSYREIQEHFGYKAVGTVQDHVKALMRKGWLEKPSAREGRRARGLLPRDHARAAVTRVPIYGEIAAGSARDAPQIELGTLVVGEGELREPCFALRVVGDSMIEAGILEGDFLLVERGARIRSGDIVVALLNGETTVKRYLVKEGGIYLVPENRRLQPIRVMDGQFEIQGKVVGLRRQF